ncbi:hypothetical protein MRX96_054237 [Rhipicephalus microplus]
MCPNGIICQLNGLYVGSRHDAGILRKSNIDRKLKKLAKGHSFCLYGDPAYPLRPLLLKPYGGNVTGQQRAFNKRMSSVSQYFEVEPPQLEEYLRPNN